MVDIPAKVQREDPFFPPPNPPQKQYAIGYHHARKKWDGSRNALGQKRMTIKLVLVVGCFQSLNKKEYCAKWKPGLLFKIHMSHDKRYTRKACSGDDKLGTSVEQSKNKNPCPNLLRNNSWAIQYVKLAICHIKKPPSFTCLELWRLLFYRQEKNQGPEVIRGRRSRTGLYPLLLLSPAITVS